MRVPDAYSKPNTPEEVEVDALAERVETLRLDTEGGDGAPRTNAGVSTQTRCEALNVEGWILSSEDTAPGLSKVD